MESIFAQCESSQHMRKPPLYSRNRSSGCVSIHFDDPKRCDTTCTGLSNGNAEPVVTDYQTCVCRIKCHSLKQEGNHHFHAVTGCNNWFLGLMNIRASSHIQRPMMMVRLVLRLLRTLPLKSLYSYEVKILTIAQLVSVLLKLARLQPRA